ncbi:MAG TPA: isopentenyl-diphosphate delta-isomerase [Bacteroidetes bacterium]|nr:isopentenyl-diphosphate delta-isomerase [Bacteroidota bacterium]
MNNDKIVSFNDEPLILVDENDHEIGFLEKDKCHQGDGILHRAFSIFLFNNNHELLMQKRSDNKLLWGNYWSNSVCSHPRRGESIEIASLRRLNDELGIELNENFNLKFLFKFQYFAKFKDLGSERELCSVFIGKYNGIIHPNPNEIKDIKYIPYDQINNELIRNPSINTPWFKLEWEMISAEFLQSIINL